MTVIEEEADKAPRKLPSKKKEKSQKKRIVKFTNTHILGSGIDLTTDFVPEKKRWG